MIRAYFYILISAVIWFAEGFLFSRFLTFSIVQTVVLGGFYAFLLFVAVSYLQRTQESPEGLSLWRSLSLAPMVTTVLGSFISLPLILLVAALGRL